MLHRPCPRAVAPRRGAAAVELAILLPLLVFVFVVAVDFARVFYYTLTLTSCARGGALYACDPVAAAQSPYASAQDAALAEATNMAPPPTVSGPSYGVGADGSLFVEVTASYSFQTITNYLGILNRLNLYRTVRIRVAQTVPNL